MKGVAIAHLKKGTVILLRGTSGDGSDARDVRTRVGGLATRGVAPFREFVRADRPVIESAVELRRRSAVAW